MPNRICPCVKYKTFESPPLEYALPSNKPLCEISKLTIRQGKKNYMVLVACTTLASCTAHSFIFLFHFFLSLSRGNLLSLMKR